MLKRRSQTRKICRAKCKIVKIEPSKSKNFRKGVLKLRKLDFERCPQNLKFLDRINLIVKFQRSDQIAEILKRKQRRKQKESFKKLRPNFNGNFNKFRVTFKSFSNFKAPLFQQFLLLEVEMFVFGTRLARWSLGTLSPDASAALGYR